MGIIKKNTTVFRYMILSALSIIFSADFGAEEMQMLPRVIMLFGGFLLASMYIGSVYMKRMEKTTEAPILDAVVVFLFMIYGAMSHKMAFFWMGLMVIIGIVLAMGGPEQFMSKK